MEVLGQPKRQLSPFRGHFEGKTNWVGCSFKAQLILLSTINIFFLGKSFFTGITSEHNLFRLMHIFVVCKKLTSVYILNNNYLQ
jgi:hypothetical protein